MSNGSNLGPPTIFGLQPVVLIPNIPPVYNSATPSQTQTSVPLNEVTGAGPIPATVPPTTFQLVEYADDSNDNDP